MKGFITFETTNDIFMSIRKDSITAIQDASVAGERTSRSLIFTNGGHSFCVKGNAEIITGKLEERA